LISSLVEVEWGEGVVVVTDFVKEIKPNTSEELMEFNVRTFFLLHLDVAHGWRSSSKSPFFGHASIHLFQMT
jgi:hypothetical protein